MAKTNHRSPAIRALILALAFSAFALALMPVCRSDSGGNPIIVNPDPDPDPDPDPPEYDPALANAVWMGVNYATFMPCTWAFAHVVNEVTGDTLNAAAFAEVMPPDDIGDIVAWLQAVNLDDVKTYVWRTKDGKFFVTPFDIETQVASGSEESFEYRLSGSGDAVTINNILYERWDQIGDDFDFQWLFDMLGSILKDSPSSG